MVEFTLKLYYENKTLLTDRKLDVILHKKFNTASGALKYISEWYYYNKEESDFIRAEIYAITDTEEYLYYDIR